MLGTPISKPSRHAEQLAIALINDAEAASGFHTDLVASYKAPEWVYIVQELSQLFYQLSVSFLGSYLFYRLVQKRSDNASREDLEAGIRAQLAAQRNALLSRLATLQRSIEAIEGTTNKHRVISYENLIKSLDGSDTSIRLVLETLEIQFDAMSDQELAEIREELGPERKRGSQSDRRGK
jgi:hypothetical protein